MRLDIALLGAVAARGGAATRDDLRTALIDAGYAAASPDLLLQLSSDLKRSARGGYRAR